MKPFLDFMFASASHYFGIAGLIVAAIAALGMWTPIKINISQTSEPKDKENGN